MDAPCKLRSSKPGKGTQRMLVLLRRHSITARGATVKRASANTPKKWKPRKPHRVWRRKHAPIFVRHRIPPGTGSDFRTVSSTSHVDWLSRDARRKYKRTCSEGVRGAHWANRFVVESRAHVFTRRKEPFD